MSTMQKRVKRLEQQNGQGLKKVITFMKHVNGHVTLLNDDRVLTEREVEELSTGKQVVMYRIVRPNHTDGE
ncbi:hypothetical protein [Desulfopila sp. IMCC35008]|uniref:hypothetical protein n=1 Tax=Desulfopila sp. IMCC35008 TaxID=2653858 RepID=UPI0013D6B1A5|nr:hypothetical protein [Desulfopila sp. IMCC35008]